MELHKRSKMAFAVFKYIFNFQRYLSLIVCKQNMQIKRLITS